MIDRKYTDGNSNVIMLMKLTSWQIITRGTVKIKAPAGSCSVPTIIIFFVLQKQLAEGITGAVR